MRSRVLRKFQVALAISCGSMILSTSYRLIDARLSVPPASLHTIFILPSVFPRDDERSSGAARSCALERERT